MLDKARKDVGTSTRWILMDRLKRHGVSINTGSRVLSIGRGELVREQSGQTPSGRFHNMMLASGSISKQHLAKALAATGMPHTVIGDGIKTGRLNDSIHGGFLTVLALQPHPPEGVNPPM